MFKPLCFRRWLKRKRDTDINFDVLLYAIGINEFKLSVKRLSVKFKIKIDNPTNDLKDVVENSTDELWQSLKTCNLYVPYYTYLPISFYSDLKKSLLYK